MHTRRVCRKGSFAIRDWDWDWNSEHLDPSKRAEEGLALVRVSVVMGQRGVSVAGRALVHDGQWQPHCESHEISAPRLTMPCRISSTMPIFEPSPAAYPVATSTSRVVDMNAGSTPPLTPYLLASQNSSGSFMPAIPRYTWLIETRTQSGTRMWGLLWGLGLCAVGPGTVGAGVDRGMARGLKLGATLVATVSLPSLMMALLMACRVVVYLLSDSLACSKESVPSVGCSKILAVPR